MFVVTYLLPQVWMCLLEPGLPAACSCEDDASSAAAPELPGLPCFAYLELFDRWVVSCALFALMWTPLPGNERERYWVLWMYCDLGLGRSTFIAWLRVLVHYLFLNNGK